MSTTISGTNGVTFPDSTSMQTGQQACKAWVNFNGTGTVAIRESYNVSSITDNGVGLYTVNFTTAMADVNYSPVVVASPIYAGGSSFVNLYSNSSTTEVAPTTSAFTLRCGYSSAGTTEDLKYICISIFSN